MEQVDDPRFDKLRFGDRGCHSQDRLVGKEHGSFRHRVNGAGETKLLQIVQQLGFEAAAVCQPLEFLGLESQVFQVLQHLLQSGGDEKASRWRQFAHEEFEHRRFVLIRFDIGLKHRQLIEVGQQCGAMRFDHARYSQRIATAPRSIIFCSDRRASPGLISNA